MTLDLMSFDCDYFVAALVLHVFLLLLLNFCVFDSQGHPTPSCLPPLPEGGPTFEVELPEVEPIDAEDSLPSANTSPTEAVGESEEEEVDEQPLIKRQHREKATTAAEVSTSERMELHDDGDSGSSTPNLKEPVAVEPINMAPPVGGKAAFGTFLDLDDFGSDEEEDVR